MFQSWKTFIYVQKCLGVRCNVRSKMQYKRCGPQYTPICLGLHSHIISSHVSVEVGIPNGNQISLGKYLLIFQDNYISCP